MVEFVKLRPIKGAGREIKASLDGLISALKGAAEEGAIQLSLSSGDAHTQWTIDLSKEKHRVAAGPSRRPDFEVAMTEETWHQIASGELAPHEAYGRGLIAVRGDLELGRRVFAHLKDEPRLARKG